MNLIPSCNQRTSRGTRRGGRKRIKHTCAPTSPQRDNLVQRLHLGIIRTLAIFLVSIMLFACADKKKDQDTILPAEQIYNESMDKLEQHKYKKAVEGFEELERTYPYSKWAVKAQIMSAYSSYKNEEFTDAIVTLDKFIALHPGNKDIAYAYYLKAICNYEQISDVSRDQGYSQLAGTSLREVVARFPGTDYARDAQGKLDLVLDYLAGKEVAIGRFYLKQGKYIAAINRFKVVVEKYQTTSAVPEALHRLVEANTALGLQDEALKYASVLGYNYPGSRWYAYSYNLIEGEKPGAKPQYTGLQFLTGIAGSPLSKLKKQPNLVDFLDKKVYDIGDKKQPAASKPISDFLIKSEVKEKPLENGRHDGKNGLVEWFRNLRMPWDK